MLVLEFFQPRARAPWAGASPGHWVFTYLRPRRVKRCMPRPWMLPNTG